MKRSPEIEALIRRFLSGVDDETQLNVLSKSPEFLAIGTDQREWWRGRDELMAVEKAVVGDFERSGFNLSPPFIHIKGIEAFEAGQAGWAAVASDIATAGERMPMRSTFVLVLEAGTWRIIQLHHSLGVPNEDIYGFELTTGLEALVSSLDDVAADAAETATMTGTTTVVFTDIEDSTRISQMVGDEAWARSLKSHFETLRRIVEAEDGTVVKTLGDGGMFTFGSARAGLTAAVNIQRATPAPAGGGQFAVRIGLHSGDVLRTEGDFVGMTVNKAARVAAAARGGEIMASTVSAELAAGYGFEFGAPRTVSLKGLEGTHQIVPVVWQKD